MNFGAGQYSYKVSERWGRAPADCAGWVSAVACDSSDRVFVYSRGEHKLIVFDRDGNYLGRWGQDVLTADGGHSLYVDKDDNVYCVDYGLHRIFKFDRHGSLVMTLGAGGAAAVEGEPFNIPTDISRASDGSLFVSDGYGNSRVHKYSPTGELLMSWGSAGDKPGQFNIPHCVRVDRYDRVWVCDRDNHRIQIFDTEGNFLSEWTGFEYPATICFDAHEDVVYLAELNYRVSVYSFEQELLAEWGGRVESDKPGEFSGYPHGLCVDSRGDVYVGQYFEGGSSAQLFEDRQLQKFIRQRQ